MFLFPLDKYPGVKLLDYMVVLFLNFWGISILFSTVAVKTYIPTNGVPGFPLSTVSFPWSLVMLSIFPCALFSCVCLLWISVYSNPLPLLNKDVWGFFFIFWCWVLWVLCIFWILISYEIYHFPIYSLI